MSLVFCSTLRNIVFCVGDVLKLLAFLNYKFLQLQQEQLKILKKSVFSNLEVNKVQVLL